MEDGVFFSLDVLFIVQITQIQYSKIYFQIYKQTKDTREYLKAY